MAIIAIAPIYVFMTGTFLNTCKILKIITSFTANAIRKIITRKTLYWALFTNKI
jgi:hypothetical protein